MTRSENRIRFSWAIALVACTSGSLTAEDELFFREQVAPIFAARCLSCHNDAEPKGQLALSTAASIRKGGESGPVVSPSSPDDSLLLDYIQGDEPEMPKDGEPLSIAQVETITRWIASGAVWPDGYRIEPAVVTDTNWWSLKPLIAPNIPDVPNDWQQSIANPVDNFVLARLKEKGMSPSPRADRRTLIRRAYFDILGLPPSPTEIKRFVHDPNPLAYERLIDELLASPHYGERWGRHWLDIVHYGDTHGYDKDKLRPNAWPYRDYVIRSLNADKPYWRFVQEQIAGDAMWPHTQDGIVATGFIAAGPWDFIGHAEVPEDKIDGKVARNLDRDDMVTSTMNTFVSTTIQCARCHNHKFDPITQEHYYSLQAIFAALDRADRLYDKDAKIAAERKVLNVQREQLTTSLNAVNQAIRAQAGDELDSLDREIALIEEQMATKPKPEFGFHSQIEVTHDIVKWVQVDLGQPTSLSSVTLVGAYDDFADIGAGFGFPRRFRIEIADDAMFSSGVQRVVDHTNEDFKNPGFSPQTFYTSHRGRYVRVTATKLAQRSDDYIFALAELQVNNTNGQNVAANRTVTALDSIEAAPRWRMDNLVDGVFREDAAHHVKLKAKRIRRNQLIASVTTAAQSRQRKQIQRSLSMITEQLERLPAQRRVYAGTVHTGSGAFRGRGHLNGKPRDVFVLMRGDIEKQGKLVSAGTIPLPHQANWQFELPTDHHESERRIRLAQWLTDRENGLTWRSIVNRIWQYHFGRGIAASANDFGRMGAEPTHPKLLDWLAATFRDSGQSLKQMHRLILTSSTYQQQSVERDNEAMIDADNRFLWRMNRRALDAESIRDATLVVSHRMNRTMFGKAFRDFVLERPEHSPHYEYHKHNPSDPKTHRRAVYRFLVRSQQQPFMQTLDCADPSQSVARRDVSITAIQALTLLNNKFMVQMSQDFAASLAHLPNTRSQVVAAFERVTGQSPTESVIASLVTHTQQFDLPNTCRVLLNLNGFLFVD